MKSEGNHQSIKKHRYQISRSKTRLPGGKNLTPFQKLDQHMTRINNQWTCSTCVINFRDKTDCRRHVEAKHINTTIYECPLCPFKCRTEYSFRKHERQHERDIEDYPVDDLMEDDEQPNTDDLPLEDVPGFDQDELL